MGFSALRVLIVGFFTAHFLSGPTPPHFGELVDNSFTFSSLAQRQMSLKSSLRRTSVCLTPFPRCVFLYCSFLGVGAGSFLKIENTVYNNIIKEKFAKKENYHPQCHLPLLIVISTPALLPSHSSHAWLFCMVMAFFLSRSSGNLKYSYFLIFFPDSSIIWFWVLSYQKGTAILSAFCQ